MVVLGQGAGMRRREFIGVVGGAVVVWPIVARAQQQQVIGFLSSTGQRQWTPFVNSFFNGLKEAGFIEAKNFRMEYRWADGQYDKLPGLAAELVRDRVDLIVTVAPPAALAAKKATNSIPIVFVSGVDPVKLGLVASVNNPGGNITGVNFVTAELGSKVLALLLELVPKVATIALLANPDNQNTVTQAKDVQAAAQSLGREARIVYANSKETILQGFEALAEFKAGAIIIATDAFFLSQKDLMVALPQRHHIPAIYYLREYPASGGLLSYGTSLPEASKALDLEIPSRLLFTADEVIE
jgi:putative ABC transport system substrate-binding protein